jgi:hypothetical protein
MHIIIETLVNINRDVVRNFEFDYIIFDAMFLAIYVGLLLIHKRYGPLRVGVICGIIIYIIDGVIWTATGIREYGLSAQWMKHPTDFMMDFSYGVVAFSWVWIAFERKSAKDVAFWTLILFAGWLLVPVASILIHLDDEPIMTVRHMDGQVWIQVAMVIVGYLLLFLLKYDCKTILYVFWIGSMLAFMMEFSLLICNIRPADIKVLIYSTLFLTNQGIPYLYLIWDKVIPMFQRNLIARKVSI